MAFPEDVLLVKSGEIAAGMWGLTDDLIAMNDKVIMTSEFLACTVVSDRHETSHTGSGRIAGGILGAVLLGPIGAAGGLMTGGKTRVDETIIYCTLTGGRSFSAEVSQLTAARMQHICQRNSANSIQQQTQSVATENALRENSVSSSDTIECPMCAERIKEKAKICRYCGHNLLEEKEKILAEIRADPSVEEVYSLTESINKYRSAVEAFDYDTSSISNENIAEILNCFSRLGDQHPEEGYRALADRVKAELNIPYKYIINDMVREGFRFIRNCGKSVPFQIRGDIIAVRRLVTSGSKDIDWAWPIQPPPKDRIIANFTDTNGEGIDIGGTKGTPVLASAAGRVIACGEARGLGRVVSIKHNKTWSSNYSHLENILVSEGQRVTRGEKIAEMGNSDADQVKLHFYISNQMEPVDPLKLLPK